MILSDIFDMLEERFTPSEIVEMLKCNEDEIDNYALKNHICPSCYCELLVSTWEDTELICEGCNNTY